MKFKAPGLSAVVVSLKSGHTFAIKPEGSDVPEQFRAAAIAAGCTSVALGKPKKGDQAPTKSDLLVAAIDKMLDTDDEGAFDGDGKPNLEALSKVVGFNVSREERDAAFDLINKD